MAVRLFNFSSKFRHECHDTWIHVSLKRIEKDLPKKNFSLPVIWPQKPQNRRGSKRHFTQTNLQLTERTAEIQCSLHVVAQGPACQAHPSEFPNAVYFFVWLTVSELWGVKVPEFSHFCLFFLYKTPNSTFLYVSFRTRMCLLGAWSMLR